jgi:hypothetical protein
LHTKKSQFDMFWRSLELEMLVYFMEYLEFEISMAIWYILWSFGVNLVYFCPFWYVAPRKIWQPCASSLPT